MKRSVLFALAAVMAVAVAPVFAARLGAVHRSLLQDNTTDTYNVTIKLLSITNLSTITNSTLFARGDKAWEAEGLAAGNITDQTLALLAANETYVAEVTQLFAALAVDGIHPSTEFAPGNTTLTALAGNTLIVTNTGTGYTLNIDGTLADIVSADNEWQGNVVHVIGPFQ